MTLDALNSLDREAFVDRLGGIFEHSPWVAEGAWPKRPFRTGEDLWKAMVSVVEAAPESDQMALVRAHPDLGTRIAMSTASTGEQAGAGLDRLSPDEYHLFREANREYREKFGFPFILAVRGKNKEDIRSALQSRLGSTPREEFQIALTEIGRIARFRLEDILAAPAVSPRLS
jgi:2-oxo-4-hydroxy-4-carboxy-5-ureidoimidazoline decarboxylase